MTIKSMLGVRICQCCEIAGRCQIQILFNEIRYLSCIPKSSEDARTAFRLSMVSNLNVPSERLPRPHHPCTNFAGDEGKRGQNARSERAPVEFGRRERRSDHGDAVADRTRAVERLSAAAIRHRRLHRARLRRLSRPQPFDRVRLLSASRRRRAFLDQHQAAGVCDLVDPAGRRTGVRPHAADPDRHDRR